MSKGDMLVLKIPMAELDAESLAGKLRTATMDVLRLDSFPFMTAGTRTTDSDRAKQSLWELGKALFVNELMDEAQFVKELMDEEECMLKRKIDYLRNSCLSGRHCQPEEAAEVIWSVTELGVRRLIPDVFETCGWKQGEAKVWIQKTEAILDEVRRTTKAHLIMTFSRYEEEGSVRKLDEKGVHEIQMVSLKAMAKALQLCLSLNTDYEQLLDGPTMTRRGVAGMMGVSAVWEDWFVADFWKISLEEVVGEMKVIIERNLRAIMRGGFCSVFDSRMTGPGDSSTRAGQESLVYAIIVSAVALLLLVYHYLTGHVNRGGTKTYSRGAFGFRSTYVSIVLFLGAYIWIKFRDVIRTKYVDGRERYEASIKTPRKEGTVSSEIYLGRFDDREEAETNVKIAKLIWSGMSGQLSLDDGRPFTVPIPRDRPDKRSTRMVKWLQKNVSEVYEDYKGSGARTHARTAPGEDSQANAGHHSPPPGQYFEFALNPENFSERGDIVMASESSEPHLQHSRSQGVETGILSFVNPSQSDVDGMPSSTNHCVRQYSQVSTAQQWSEATAAPLGTGSPSMAGVSHTDIPSAFTGESSAYIKLLEERISSLEEKVADLNTQMGMCVCRLCVHWSQSH